jgi:hypothetical protein
MAEQKPIDDYSWTEPASTWDVKPPLNNVTQTESGHFMEMDDSPGAERVRIQHRTGTFTEIQANGQQINKIMGDRYEIIAKDNNVLIRGVCNITVEGDSVLHVKGDAYTQVDGDAYNTVKGKSTTHTEGKTEVFSEGDINLFAGSATGSVTIRAAEAVNIHSDLNVSGSINSNQSISAVENVTAGMQLSSNLGIQTLGPITALGSITSAISVSAPLISGLIVSDMMGPMMKLRMIYNAHTHPKAGPNLNPDTGGGGEEGAASTVQSA